MNSAERLVMQTLHFIKTNLETKDALENKNLRFSSYASL